MVNLAEVWLLQFQLVLFPIAGTDMFAYSSSLYQFFLSKRACYTCILGESSVQRGKAEYILN